jgi:hypothetical protein
MQTCIPRRKPRAVYYSIALLLALAQAAFAAGIVTNNTDTALRAALVGGGTVTFATDGTIALTNTISIASPTVIDGTGHSVVISGGYAVRLFQIEPNVSFTLISLTLADGLARGTNGGPAIDGGPGEGGAIYSSGNLSALNCAFLSNIAQGGEGGTGTNASPRNGNGGPALGGAVYVNGGFLTATNCTFALNSSLGGTGAVANLGSLSVISTGGDANGGALHNQGGDVRLVDCLFSGNQALAGPGRRFSVLEASFGGTAHGGAICNNTGELRVVHCTLSGNSSTAGKARAASGGAIHQDGANLYVIESLLDSNRATGGGGFQGGAGSPIAGGTGYGGGCSIAAGAVWLTNSTLSGNLALGGGGYYYGNVGSGFGGGFFSSGTLQAINSTIALNTARSGAPGYSSANQGSGLGGGLYNSGGSMVMNHVTISGNSAEQITGGTPGTGSALGGGVHSTTGTATLHGTIVANSLSGGNAFGTLVDNGYNLSSDLSCNFTNTGSLNNSDPKLGPLDDYGGPTPTMPLLAGSLAMDGGDPTGYPLTDQRGRSRPYGSASDIGAYESSPPYIIRGQVSGFTLASEVLVSSGVIKTTTTNHGTYSLESLAAGDHAVTPSSADYLFVPDSRLVTVGPDQLGVNFKAYRWNALSMDGISGNLMYLAYAGTSGNSVQLLTSSNLFNWSAISTNTIGSSNLLEFRLPFSTETPRQFYRTMED